MAVAGNNMATVTALSMVLLLSLALVAPLAATNVTIFDEGDSEYSDSFEELELELQRRVPEERRASNKATGWSSWSEWSLCSRSCDGGAAHQLRKCTASSGCPGEAVRYKICNMQPCPESGDFRLQQCDSFNEVPYEGVRLEWTPHYDDMNTCALTCKGVPQGERKDTEDEPIVVQLAPKVQDGTRCRLGSLDMCIDGLCRRVGCDLRIGSQRRVDACGVCGGDGSSCAQPMYHWEEAALSLCSATCGGGYKMSRPVCRNRLTGAEVDEPLCNASQRPDSKVVECNTHRCPAKWVADEWGPCTLSCGTGFRIREVFCAEDGNGTRSKVPEQYCHGVRPRHQEACNQEECPSWTMGGWSGCSVSCGEGLQGRSVECRDVNDAPSDHCDEATKPPETRSCQTGIPCPVHRLSFFGPRGPQTLPGNGDHTQPLVQPYPPLNPLAATAERLVGEQIVPSEFTFIAEEWGPCNVSCGNGVRHRSVDCKIFLDFSKTVITVPDFKCHGPKPAEWERCILPPCPASANKYDLPDPADSTQPGIKVVPGYPNTATRYSWRKQGFTHCSASCLGGVQEVLIQCIREDTQKPVSPYLCKQQDRPEGLIQTCNDHPCPPRWNYSDFQECTKPCGIGIQTREVTCIHEVTRGGSNTIIVPNNLCPQPPPPDRQYCNVLDCPIRWHTSDWTKCSKSCGGGLKTRQVECKQVMAQNHVMARPANKCPSSKPQDKKPCNTKSCVLESDRPFIPTQNHTFVQNNPSKKKLSLKIGGQAVVFFGTQVRIKCPVKRFNRTKIQWAKDRNYISNSKKYKISKKGALRIQSVTQRDSGVYTCVAGKSSAELVLSVKPRPGEFGTISSEEIHGLDRQHGVNRLPDQTMLDHTFLANSGAANDGRRPFISPGDDMSHESSPPGKVPLKQLTTNNRGRAPPTRPPPPPAEDEDDEEEEEPPYPSYMPGIGTGRPHFEGTPDSLSPPRISDTFGGGLPTSTSGSSRPMPHFQQLLASLQNLWPFQTFGNSRGHRMVKMEEERQADREDEDAASTDDGLGPVVVLGKGSAGDLKFDWMITDWSKCSQYCGGNGFQMRAAHCMVRLHNNTQGVDANLCEEAGMPSPTTIQKCGVQDCPRWVSGPWSECEQSRCFTWNTAMQKRDIVCQLSNGTEVDMQLCGEVEKPPQRQECYNDKCKGTWKVGEWSECVAMCDAQGIKYRILQCVWYGTKKPAGNACRDQPRPSVMKVCKGPPCSHMLECIDQSKYCPNVKAMNMCRVHRYQYQCCHSCRNKG